MPAGSGEVRFKDVAYKDLAIQVQAAEKVSKQLQDATAERLLLFLGRGATDVNHDNVLDVVSGPHVFYGPDYTQAQRDLPAAHDEPFRHVHHRRLDAVRQRLHRRRVGDALNCSFTGACGCSLYVNPKGEPRRWDKHPVVPAYQTEIGVLHDMDGDRKPELVYGAEGQMRYAKPDPANPTGTWIIRNVSERGYATAHGRRRWRHQRRRPSRHRQPVRLVGAASRSQRAKQPWTYHPQAFGRYKRGVGGSVMAVYDVNGDKLNDVVTVLAAHGWGLAWFEQKRDAQGSDLVRAAHDHGRPVDEECRRRHVLAAARLEFRRRQWRRRLPTSSSASATGLTATTISIPILYGPAVLYWYKTVRNPKAPGGAEFVPELIHNRSGTGSDVYPVDLNKDGRLDVVTATRFGTFIFWNNVKP